MVFKSNWEFRFREIRRQKLQETQQALNPCLLMIVLGVLGPYPSVGREAPGPFCCGEVEGWRGRVAQERILLAVGLQSPTLASPVHPALCVPCNQGAGRILRVGAADVSASSPAGGGRRCGSLAQPRLGSPASSTAPPLPPPPRSPSSLSLPLNSRFMGGPGPCAPPSHTYTHTHTYTHSLILRSLAFTDTHAYTYTHTHTYTCTYTHSPTHTSTHISLYTSTHSLQTAHQAAACPQQPAPPAFGQPQPQPQPPPPAPPPLPACGTLLLLRPPPPPPPPLPLPLPLPLPPPPPPPPPAPATPGRLPRTQLHDIHGTLNI
ncbi:uncharacterized protein LOC144455956 [Phascolarctos cinereus]